MALKLVTDIKVGNPDQNGWTYCYDSSKEHLVHTNIYLCVLFSFESRTSVNQDEITQRIVSILYTSFFGNNSKSTFNALKSVVDELVMYLQEEGLRVSLSAVSYDETAVFVAASGGAEVVIYRNRSFSKLIVSSDNPVVASGYPKTNDVLILSTYTLTHAIDLPDVQKAVIQMSSMRTRISNLLEANFDTKVSSAGVLFLMFMQEAGLDKVDVSARLPESPLVGSDQINSKKGSFLASLNGIGSLLTRKQSDSKLVIEPQEILLDDTKKKTSLTLGIIIIILLMVSIFFGFRKQKEEEIKQLYQPQLEQATHEYDEALTLYSVSPERSRDHFQESMKIVDALIAEGVEDSALTELKTKLSENRGKILGEYHATSSGFMDLSLKSDEFSGDDMFMVDETIYVLDRDTERAISVEVDTKKSEVVAGPGAISAPYYISAYAGRVYVSSSTGLTRVDSGKSVVVEESFSEKSLPYSYSSNVYIVNTDESKIYRHTGFDGGLAERDEWLTEGATPDLSKIVSFVVDGSIWMVSSSGGVFKFSLGNQVNFTISGVYPAITAPTQIYTNEVLEYLYVLEPSQKRVIVLTKEGGFVAQYISDTFEKTIDFGVSEEKKLIYVLTGEKIESVELGHL